MPETVPPPIIPEPTLGRIYALLQRGEVSSAENLLAQHNAVAALQQRTQAPVGLLGRVRASVGRFLLGAEANALVKSLSTGKLTDALARQDQAAVQGTVVNAAWDAFDAYGTTSSAGVTDPTGITFRLLRSMAHHCEPAAAIIEKRIQQVAAFAKPAKMRGAKVASAGFRIALAEEDAVPNADDKKRIRELTKLVMNCGYGPPPPEERPIGWKPGFEAWTRAIMRDALTLDWVAIRRWKGRNRPDLFPLYSFSWEDAGCIRRLRGTIERVVNGVRVRVPYVRTRQTTSERIAFVKTDNDTGGGEVIEEFTAHEIAVGFRNPRTEECAAGYGYPELERAVNAITIWLYSRDYNASRFRTDSLPRGILTIFGSMDKSQLDTFRLKWREMFGGVSKRWGFPILTAAGGSADAGGRPSASWLSIDPSSRDMEYHQFMFAVSLWLHALFGIHPEETGYEALSPFKPPLSQASPETKLKYSQDSGLEPLLRWLCDFINREILSHWDPEGRFRFEWVGLGEQDALADAQTALARLNAGQTTPRLVMASEDIQIPDWLEDCPLIDLPMPLAQGIQLMLQLLQAQQSMEMQQQQADAAAQQQQQTNDQQAGMAMAGGMPPGQGQPAGAGAPASSPMFGQDSPASQVGTGAGYTAGSAAAPSAGQEMMKAISLRDVTIRIALPRK